MACHYLFSFLRVLIEMTNTKFTLYTHTHTHTSITLFLSPDIANEGIEKEVMGEG